jgi:hypothetical protein
MEAIAERDIKIQTGIYDGLPEAIYHEDSFPSPVLSTSVIKDMLFKSPYHAWVNHPALNPQYQPEEDEEKFDVGRMAHCLLLEGLDKAVVVEFDSWRTKDARAERDAIRLDGKIPLLRTKYDDIAMMVSTAVKFLRTSELHIDDLQAEGKAERSFIWQEGDLWFKCRPDWMPNDNAYILDYKSTGKSANPETLDKHILSMGYDIQDALYKRGTCALLEKQIPFVFLFQETTYPFACSLNSLNPAFAGCGLVKMERGINLWRGCMAENYWPGYPTGICHLEPPPWAVAQMMEMEEEL